MGVPYCIEQASDHTARLVLHALCAQSKATADAAIEVLNVIKARDKTSSDARLGKTAAAKHGKVDGEVPLVCATCDTFYYEKDNSKTACQFHDGVLEEHEDSFPDTDWFHIEGRDYNQLREEFPYEYEWTCCEKLGSDDPRLGKKVMLREGCVKRRHMTKEQLENGEDEIVSTSDDSDDDDDLDSGVSDDESNSDSDGTDSEDKENKDNNRKRSATAEADDGSSKKPRRN